MMVSTPFDAFVEKAYVFQESISSSCYEAMSEQHDLTGQNCMFANFDRQRSQLLQALDHFLVPSRGERLGDDVLHDPREIFDSL
jgi:hypothetical protein